MKTLRLEMGLENSPLGNASTTYPKTYDKSVLFAIERSLNRQDLDLAQDEALYGHDLWNAWELSWLNQNNTPVVAVGVFVVPCSSKFIIESKSLKLYLNSLNGSNFASIDQVEKIITDDLSEKAGAAVDVTLTPLDDIERIIPPVLGVNIDHHAVSVSHLEYDPRHLKLDPNSKQVEEILVSNLLKSNCPVTNQPDWASVSIHYRGNKIAHESLLRYILSFREHNEFHEHCVERIFMAIKRLANPSLLTVEARYTRRGGLDINPFRSLDKNFTLTNKRTVRQ